MFASLKPLLTTGQSLYVRTGSSGRCLHWLAHTLDINRFKDDFNDYKYEETGLNYDFDFNLLNTRYVTQQTIQAMKVKTSDCPLNEWKLFRHYLQMNATIGSLSDDFLDTLRDNSPKRMGPQDYSEGDIERFVEYLIYFSMKNNGFNKLFHISNQLKLNWDSVNKKKRKNIFENKTKGFIAVPDKVLSNGGRLFLTVEVKKITEQFLIENMDEKNYRFMKELGEKKEKHRDEYNSQIITNNFAQTLAQMVWLADYNLTNKKTSQDIYGLLVRNTYYHFFATNISNDYIFKLRSKQLTPNDTLNVMHISDGIGLNSEDEEDFAVILKILFMIMDSESLRI
ncbi:uncharacterized protein LOC128965394 [Oppia nitens]|uniref:uncharacterized protein LOC128965394 n=1 Tax=Oppia nitens TaxID=1686743 RepID=UPI0023DC4820|nr:uncharacterized protein LOC128965394 [Oppia nitens]